MESKFESIILEEVPEIDEPTLRTIVGKLCDVVKENDAASNAKEPKLVQNKDG